MTPCEVPRPQITEQQARLRNHIQRRLETPQLSQPPIQPPPATLVPRRLARPLSQDRRLERRKRRSDALRVDPYFLPRGPEITGSAWQVRPLKRRRQHQEITVRLHDEHLKPPSSNLERSPERHFRQLHDEELLRNPSDDGGPKHTIRVFDENGVDRTAEYRRPTVSAGFLKSDVAPSSNTPPKPSTDLRRRDIFSSPFTRLQKSRFHGRAAHDSILPSDLDSLRHRPRIQRHRCFSPSSPQRDAPLHTEIPVNFVDPQNLNIHTDFTDMHDLHHNLPTLSELPLPAVRQQTSTRPASTMFDMTEQRPLQKRLRTLSPMRTTSSARFLPEPDACQVSFPPVEICPNSPLQQPPNPHFYGRPKYHASVLSQLPWDPEAVSSEILDFESGLIDKPDLSVPQFIKKTRGPLSEIRTEAESLPGPGVAVHFASEAAQHGNEENVFPQSLGAKTLHGGFRRETRASPEIHVAVQLPHDQGNPIAQASER